MQIKVLAIAALVAGSQAQSLAVPVVSPLVSQLLSQLGAVGTALETATGLTSGAGNNPLGLAGSLPGIITSLATVSNLVRNVNSLIPLFGNGGTQPGGSLSNLAPADQQAVCDAVGNINVQQAKLTAGVEKLRTNSPIVGGVIGGTLAGVINLLVNVFKGLSTPGCTVTITPGTGGVSGGLGGGI
ncbi:uncharacterized protein B0I36DRAFT_362313 [Microdochium trichocladiopsis]|uniref:Hydrophobic surface binding protein A-domain-containing protein n=1 Tax=Microdochium trichocladiopsis TaxID=1682393 RepID=A0A9P9BSB2_9PEZI|nr:uncharacterized protein B0I36DRAFT_362313 [Microdochium trichocladiopsis]KAH7033670.1 hypothetical protein B0I36DRAFT_362313 [Microdochium trichocladiopsis]